MLPKIQAEKNSQALEEAQAKLKQLKTTYDLKRAAPKRTCASCRSAVIAPRTRCGQAESNADRMAIQSPISGMAVLRPSWKSNNMAEVQEGEEVRSGMPIVDVVNPSSMRVRSKVNQADVGEIRPGLTVRIGLDAYPDLAFTGRVVQVSPLAVTSALSPKVRNFIARSPLTRSTPSLMLRPDRFAGCRNRAPALALSSSRDALRFDGNRCSCACGAATTSPTRRSRSSDERTRGGRDVGARRWCGGRAQCPRREPGLR
jgi:hypothetical protein